MCSRSTPERAIILSESTGKSAGRFRGAAAEILELRAALLARTREFFSGRGIIEVETPLLSRGVVVDRHLDPPVCRYSPGADGAGETLYLQTSPEAAMKRLLAQRLDGWYEYRKTAADQVEQAQAPIPEPEVPDDYLPRGWKPYNANERPAKQEPVAMPAEQDYEITELLDELGVSAIATLGMVQASSQRGDLDPVTIEPFQLNTGGSAFGPEVERVCTENELVITVWSPIHLRSRLNDLYWKDD